MPTATTRRSEQSLDGGVHVPFIAPLLSGVRVRTTGRSLEFLLPNPSGGRGVYVADWNVVAEFASPTLHDTLLVSRLAALDQIAHGLVRQAAASVALDGYAGRLAAEHAEQAQAAIETGMLRLRARFLLALVHRAGFDQPAEAARCLATDGFTTLSMRLGWRPQQLAEGLEQLSVECVSLATSGHPHAAGPAQAGRMPIFAASGGRWTRLLALMKQLGVSLAEEQFRRTGPDGTLLNRIIMVADQCVRQGEHLLPVLDRLLSDPLPLLEAWRDGSSIEALVKLQTLEAAFDGWDRICLLWFDARTPSLRQFLLPEIAVLARATGNGDAWPLLSTPGRSAAATGNSTAAEGRERRLERNERIRSQELALEFQEI